MADNTFNIKVVVSDSGGTKLAEQNISKLGAAVDRVGHSHKEASKHARDYYNRQEKGVIGTASSGRSFSKLAQTIGSGDTGLVGAYATLAANIFAVSAAFNALRGAAQAEQVLKGLEAAGTRTGLSLRGTAQALKEVTGNAISMEQAMRSTAQISSAGFDETTIKKIGQAAKDVSFALGRNMTDSIDRLTRGMIKLEPELLDELGVFTKLTESNQRYAAQLNKSETQLSSYERRVGFTNAVLAELDLKFGGLSDAAGDTMAYDKLAATFTDLTNTVMNFLNIIGRPIASVLSSSMLALAGAAAMFASTIKSQMMPALANSAERATASAKAFRDLAAQKVADAKQSRETAVEQHKLNLESKATFDYLGDKAPAKYKKLRSEIIAGTRDAEEGLKSLRQSQRMHEDQLAKHSSFTTANPEARAAKERTIQQVKDEINAVEKLREARKTSENDAIAGSEAVRRATMESRVAAREAVAAEASANSMTAAANLNLVESWKQLNVSVGAYHRAQVIATTAGQAGLTGLQKAAVVTRTSMYALATGAKVVGTAFLTVLPYLGLIMAAAGMLKGAWESMKTDKLKKLESSLESLNEVLSKANTYGEELVRINNSQATAAQRAAAALTLQANAINEATSKFDEYVAANKDYVDSPGFFERMFPDEKTKKDVVAAWYDAGGAAQISYMLGLKKTSEAQKLGEILGAHEVNGLVNPGNLTEEERKIVEYFNTIEQTNKKTLDNIMKTKGGYTAFFSSLSKLSDGQKLEAVQKLGDEVKNSIGSAADAVKGFEEAQKKANDTLGEFGRSMVQKTPFDAVVKDLDALVSSVQSLKKVTDSTQLSDMLSGLDANTLGMLDPRTIEKLQEYTKADATRQKQKEEGAKYTHREYLDTVNILNTHKNIGQEVLQQLEAKAEMFRQAQQEDRLYKAREQLLNAQLSTMTKIYSAGAAGRKAQIKDEERVRDLQVAQLNSQADMQKMLMAQAQLTIEQLELNKKRIQSELEIKEALYGQVKAILEGKLASEHNLSMSAVLAGKVSTSTLSDDAKNIVYAYQGVDVSLERLNKKREELLATDQQILVANRNMRDYADGLKAVNLSISAIKAKELTIDQQRASMMEAELNLRSQTLFEYRSQQSTLREINSVLYETAAIQAGMTDSLEYQVKLIQENARNERKARFDAYKEKVLSLRVAKEIAEAEASRPGLTADQRAAASSLVASANEQLKVTEQSYLLEIQLINANERKNLAAKTYFDTTKEGLTWQQNSLDMLQKQLEVQKSLTEETSKTGKLNKELDYKSRNMKPSESGERAMEIEAAAKAYELAVKESGIKKGLIDLEYALLEAQKDQLEHELQARKALLNASDPGDAIKINQINSTLDKLSRVDLSKSAEQAKEVLDTQLKNQAKELELLMMRDATPTKGMEAIARMQGNRERREAREEAQRILDNAKQEKAKSENIVNGETEAQRAARLNSATKAANPMIASNEKLIETLGRLITTIEKQIGAVTSDLQGPTGPVSTTGKPMSINDAYDYAQKAGLRPWQLKGRGRVGGHGRNSSHYTGEGFDVQGITKNDWENPEAKKRMDALADFYRKQGLVVLWGVKGHYDHMHVEIVNASQSAIKNAAELSRQALQNLSAQTAQTIKETPKVVYDAAKAAVSEVVDPAASMGSPIIPQTVANTTTTAANDNTETDPIVVEGKRPRKNFRTVKGDELREVFDEYEYISSDLIEQLKQLGPEGELVAGVSQGCLEIARAATDAFEVFTNANATLNDKIVAGASVLSAALSTVQNALASASQAKIESVDKEIAAEQKRDGKSAESLAKIQAMERKKEEIARKQFNTNKKLQMAQAVISTASGVAQALTMGPIVGPIMAAMVGALGAAQIAIIAGTQYQSSASKTAETQMPSALNIGKRGDTVNLAKQNNNLGGEIGYLRGNQGIGSNSSNYKVIGSAYGGELPRGYGNSAYIVGEKGPETIMPDTPITVRPANDNAGQAPVNATLNIQALDSRGVAELLQDQRGNIISMLREAANANGQRFLEDVNVDVYTRPNVSRL